MKKKDKLHPRPLSGAMHLPVRRTSHHTTPYHTTPLLPPHLSHYIQPTKEEDTPPDLIPPPAGSSLACYGTHAGGLDSSRLLIVSYLMIEGRWIRFIPRSIKKDEEVYCFGLGWKRTVAGYHCNRSAVAGSGGLTLKGMWTVLASPFAFADRKVWKVAKFWGRSGREDASCSGSGSACSLWGRRRGFSMVFLGTGSPHTHTILSNTKTICIMTCSSTILNRYWFGFGCESSLRCAWTLDIRGYGMRYIHAPDDKMTSAGCAGWTSSGRTCLLFIGGLGPASTEVLLARRVVHFLDSLSSALSTRAHHCVSVRYDVSCAHGAGRVVRLLGVLSALGITARFRRATGVALISCDVGAVPVFSLVSRAGMRMPAWFTSIAARLATSQNNHRRQPPAYRIYPRPEVWTASRPPQADLHPHGLTHRLQCIPARDSGLAVVIGATQEKHPREADRRVQTRLGRILEVFLGSRRRVLQRLESEAEMSCG
ncbi:hypothetical protein BDQ17DRAFT_1432958 [Cyathus striatus]|nr:hypothetical protein BDQ17DRAFT_1432958 [Cyathus striatus]